MLEILEKLSSLTGWAPIALVTIALIPIGIFFYNRELSNKDVTIQRLSMELENLKQYSPSLLIQNLGQHVKEYENEIGRLNKELSVLNNEVETETRRKSIIEQEKNNVLGQLEIAHSDILRLKEQLKSYEEDLEDLFDDHCEICDPDEDHPGGNFIDWGSAVYPLTGLEELIEKVGSCHFCNSPQIKCSVCRSITSISLDDYDKVECTGGCGVMYQLVVDYHEHNYEIEVSREDE